MVSFEDRLSGIAARRGCEKPPPPASILHAAMVKLSEKIAAAEAASDAPWVAFEFFPPRTADGVANLYKRFDRMTLQGACA